uniref:glycosyltransferase n=1 Tax=uncultured Dysgonomonas sp. TaxID=206096 RepID=UPI002634C1BA|nr:glycosyltransferase [uncultured Dysgonomonas sp.]
MRLIINTSSLFSGGGVQVALSFIEECRNFEKNEYHVFLCPSVEKQIDKLSYPSNFIFYTIERKGNIIRNILYLRKKLSSFEKKIKPDCVFTIFGPSYWTPKVPHLLGYALPHFLYSESPFFFRNSLLAKLKWKITAIFKKYFFLKNAKYYHVETEDARMRLAHFLHSPIDKIYVVSNTYNSYFACFNNEERDKMIKSSNIKTFLILSAFYPHKNLSILNEIIPLLIKSGINNVEFVTTLPSQIYEDNFLEVSKTKIRNIGVIAAQDCPQLYFECNFIFLPTLLECFSANYPEAMKMDKPILTSDLPFARDICGDAALFFDPLDPNDIVAKIKLILENEELQKELITNGREQLKNFPSAQMRAEKYLTICNSILNEN